MAPATEGCPSSSGWLAPAQRRQGRGISSLWACLALLAGCASAPPVPDRPAAAPRPGLPEPTSGTYALTKDGAPVGEERFTVTSSGGVWRLEGQRRLHGAVSWVQGYVLEVDEGSAEPRAFSFWLEIEGVKNAVRGERHGEVFRVDGEGAGGVTHREVAYGAGTAIGGASPVMRTFVLALLASTFLQGQPVPVRTVRLLAPRFEAHVELETYTLRGQADGLRRIELTGPQGRSTALWIRADGLPVKFREWIDEGPPLEGTLIPTD